MDAWRLTAGAVRLIAFLALALPLHALIDRVTSDPTLNPILKGAAVVAVYWLLLQNGGPGKRFSDGMIRDRRRP